LLLNVFFKDQIVSKSTAAGASPQTPLGELTALPRPPNCFQGVRLLRKGRGRMGGERGEKMEENGEGARGNGKELVGLG